MKNRFLDEIKTIIGMTKEAVRTETSMDDLRSLLDLGYTTVTWMLSYDPCPICQAIGEGTTWDLAAFLAETHHDAPIFSHGHVNDRCTLRVAGPGLDDKIVDWQGIQ